MEGHTCHVKIHDILVVVVVDVYFERVGTSSESKILPRQFLCYISPVTKAHLPPFEALGEITTTTPRGLKGRLGEQEMHSVFEENHEGWWRS
jgi:hypothetical protein